jgi:hypothetical protein
MTDFDSRPDTYEHIQKVQDYILLCVVNLIGRSEKHDQSKLSGIEKEAFDIATPKLAHTEYGSDEYRSTLREIKPAIEEHYKHNSHHPEHYEEGIAGMSLLDILEMLCDWKAAGERHDSGGDIAKSIEINKERWGISDELTSILTNTARELGMIA